MSRTHIVQTGETLAQIAESYGLSSWHELYDAQSEQFRRDHPDPESVMPGVLLHLPEMEPSDLDETWRDERDLFDATHYDEGIEEDVETDEDDEAQAEVEGDDHALAGRFAICRQRDNQIDLVGRDCPWFCA